MPHLFHINLTRKTLDDSIPHIDIIQLCEKHNIQNAVITDLSLVPLESVFKRLFSIAEGLNCHNI